MQFIQQNRHWCHHLTRFKLLLTTILQQKFSPLKTKVVLANVTPKFSAKNKKQKKQKKKKHFSAEQS